MSTFTSEPGTRLGGRYRLEDRLAAAGGWSAWKAIDEILARPVSVITFAAGFPRLEQVITAARAASRLTDTRLTQVFDVEDSWEHAYIVLEWPFGETLADLIADEALDPLAAARIVADVAGALSGAHAAGLAHLCLRPDAIRWTPGGGVKVTGLGIDAALSGTSAEDPELADTRGLGQLLYASLTGMWPGPDYPELPAAPTADGLPRRPRQVLAGVPTFLDEVTCRALALPGRDGESPFSSPAQIAAALAAGIPPVQIPPAAAPRHLGEDAGGYATQPWQPGRRHSVLNRSSQQHQSTSRRAGRMATITLALVAVVGASAAAVQLLHNKSPSASAPGGKSTKSSTSPSGQASLITPVWAHGFDALNLADTGDENSSDAQNVLNSNPAGWATQEYKGSPYFGNLKAGTGMILNLGRAAQVSSVTVAFGTQQPGADVSLLMGSSSARSKANLDSMTTVASANGVTGSYTFTVRDRVSDQYLVIWFTKLPPMAQRKGWYMAQIFSVAVRGTS